MSTTRDRRVAYHEAGHAVAAYLFKRPIDFVTIDPIGSAAGLVQYRRPRLSERDLVAIDGRLSILAPARVRRSVETCAVITLAGRETQEMALRAGLLAITDKEMVDQDVFEPGPRRAQPLPAPRPAAATPTEQAAMEGSGEGVVGDALSVVQQIGALAFDDAELHALHAYLLAVTRALVGSDEFWRLVHTLVPELLVHRTLGGRRVRRLLKEPAL